MANNLEHLAEFQKVLEHYRISAAAKDILAQTRLVIMVGPTSAGRNTVINALVKTGAYHFIVSDTTRQPRKNNGILEKNGREYWFRTEEEVLADLRQGKFLEAALIHGQQVSGISIRELEQARKEGKIAVNEVEVVGAQNIVEAKPDTFVLFVVPPSFDVWMRRMDGRGKMPEAEKHRRLESAIKEFEAALTKSYYIFMVNDEFEHSVERIHQMVLSGTHDSEHQVYGRGVTERLLIDTKKYLSQARGSIK